MSGNTIGKMFKLTTFGESHCVAVGGIIDGMPSKIEIDRQFIQNEINRRKTGQSAISSQRKEVDNIEILSGIFEDKTLGTPIAFLVKNSDQISKDYDHLKDVFRPSHGDFTYQKKYGHRDYRGGGRASARETLVRVAGGAFAKTFLKTKGISIMAYVSQIGNIGLEKNLDDLDLRKTENSKVRCPDKKTSERMISYLDEIKAEGDTCGGIINCIISACPPGLGEPVFDKLNADLAKAIMSINAVKAFEYGSGFASAAMKGSEHNDSFVFKNNKISTETNNSGGIQAGISNGEDIFFRVAFKPIPSIMKKHNVIDKNGKITSIEGKGRHDVCVVPRAVPIVEAMAAIIITDHYLRYQAYV
ncbi:MAG: chorismate synthase [Bacteroidales bacterium]|nr:chorismate synthase [Bacteroidales bacterium]